MSCYINYGSSKINFDLPTGWDLISQGSPPLHLGKENVEEGIKRALDNPVDSPRIEEIVTRRMRVVILFDDWTRPTPAYFAFPEILKRLTLSGVDDKDITAICALGTHSPMSNEDFRRKIGDGPFDRLFPRVINHDPLSQDNVIIGRTSCGSLIEINRLVLNADLVIGIGSCMPHPHSGFGGGSKMIMPGVSGVQAVKDHHVKWWRNPRVCSGSLDGNPFHQEQNEHARMIRLFLKIDFVLNENNQVVNVYFGDVFSEHKKAAKECTKVYSVKIPKLADVTIASAYPLDRSLRQTTKGLNTAANVTRGGGCIILAADTNEDSKHFQNFIDSVASVRSANDYHRSLMNGQFNPPCPPYGVDFHIGVLLMKMFQEKFSRIVYVTHRSSKTQIEKIGFTHADSIQNALASVKEMAPSAEVLVLPAAGITLPELEC